MSSADYRYIWSRQDLTDLLNELGYVHFVTKDAVSEFKEGKAFYFCPTKRQYGFVSTIPYTEVENIKKNEEYLQKQKGLKMNYTHKDLQDKSLEEQIVIIEGSK